MLEKSDKPDSYVLEVISGRGSLYEIIRREENLRRLEALNSEINFNIETFNRIHKTFEETKGIPALRFRTSAIKLFITNRYVNLSKEEYETLEDYYDDIRLLNGQLRVIEHDQDATKKFLQSRKEEDQSSLEKIKKLIDHIFKDVSKSIS